MTQLPVDVFTRDQGDAPVSHYSFADVPLTDDDLVATGGDLEPGTLINAYSHGLFPMPVRRRSLGWFCPVTRGVIPLADHHVSRSLAKSMKKFTYSVDTAFAEVMRACGDPRRDHGWINEEFVEAYTRLHHLGWAHSVEVRLDDRLVGGIYGVRVRRFFAGESMFHTETDASKAALAVLVDLLRRAGIELFDVQWTTPHLRSLGAVDVPRVEYLARLAAATKTVDSRQTDHHG
jgi:leucyl/phenylalanyl-tRNA--protein transferase